MSAFIIWIFYLGVCFAASDDKAPFWKTALWPYYFGRKFYQQNRDMF